MPFGFSFYGKTQTTAFVNSDGNITFEEADKSSTERNVARLLTGPPRVSPFLADLDPSTGSGRIFLNAAADQYTVTWCNVRGFDSHAHGDGAGDAAARRQHRDDLRRHDQPRATRSSGSRPGRTGTFTPVNLSDAGPTDGGAGAVGERFAQNAQLDRRRAHAEVLPDASATTTISSCSGPTRRSSRDAFAYETTVKNEIRGIGVDIYDRRRRFRQRRPAAQPGGDGLARQIPGQSDAEVPRREQHASACSARSAAIAGWRFWSSAIAPASDRDALLGRDLAHWSFFFDSDASVMEGNDIEDLGGGSFRTVAAVQRYSLLDQYAMGLVPDADRCRRSSTSRARRTCRQSRPRDRRRRSA